ncbi:MAG TPA: hypothetical protein VF020_12745, partial [Chthoniobacterales bacterium]
KRKISRKADFVPRQREYGGQVAPSPLFRLRPVSPFSYVGQVSYVGKGRKGAKVKTENKGVRVSEVV